MFPHRTLHYSLFTFLFSLTLLSCGPKPAAVSAPAEAADDDTSRYYPTLAVGAEAPDFTLADTLGVALTLSTLRGTPVVLDFYASWCGDCRAELPAVKALQAELAPQGYQFVGVSFDHDGDAWRSLLRTAQLPWPQVSNGIRWKENPVGTAYGLHWIPTLVLVDADGRIAATALTAEELKEKIAR